LKSFSSLCYTKKVSGKLVEFFLIVVPCAIFAFIAVAAAVGIIPDSQGKTILAVGLCLFGIASLVVLFIKFIKP